MFIFLYRFFMGTLHIRLTTSSPEKFLNLCYANGIEIFKSRFKGKNLYFKTSIKSFKELRKINRRFSGKVHIVSKVGLPFFLYKNRERYGFLAGLTVFFLYLFIMSRFVWCINVSGTSLENTEKIINSLKEVGIYEGVRASSIDAKTVRNELLLKVNELSWAAINIEGSTVTIDVKETTKKDSEDTTPSNIYAEYDGVIKSVEALTGTAVVKPGQAVRKGDMLISGIVEYSTLHTELVRARGTVTAEIEETLKYYSNFKIKEKIRTGETKERTVLEIFSLKIPLYFGEITGDFECDIKSNNIKLFGKNLPIRKITKTFYFIEERENYFTKTNMKSGAEKILNEKIEKFIGDGKLLGKEISEIEDEKGIEFTAKILCEKDICREEKLLIGTSNQ